MAPSSARSPRSTWGRSTSAGRWSRDGGSRRHPRVLVVGGGIAGACVADNLARETDAAVTVLERTADPVTETTAKSGAFVGFWGHESPACVPLLRYGIDYYRDLLADRAAPRYVHGGRLRIATTRAGDDAIRRDFVAHLDRALDGDAATGQKGAPVQYLTGPRLADTLVLPGLDVGAIRGALYSPGVGHVDDPAVLARAVLDRATAAGATVDTGRTVTEIETEGGRVVGIRAADGGTTPADAVVAATGPWNRRLLSTAGVDLPVRNTRGPMLRLDGDHHRLPALFNAFLSSHIDNGVGRP